MNSFHEKLVAAAFDEGFPLAGAVDIELAAPYFEAHVGRYDAWLAAGHEGAMEYLRRGRDRRADPKLVLPEAKSVFCVALPYPAPPAGNADPAHGPRYARYLRRTDYHENIAARLGRVMERVAASSSTPRDLRWKVCVDTSAVLERAWAALAGLGWIGKNSLLIHPQYGSYLFLAEVLMTVETGAGPRLLPNYCGNCSRCLDSCPTKAILSPGVINASRCIAYWTLEKRGDLPIEEKDRQAIGTWIAGCDICQEICPFNTKAAHAAATRLIPDDSANGALALDRWEELLDESELEYKARIKNSALSRVKPAQFRRNLAISVANAWPSIEGGERRAGIIARVKQKLPEETDPAALLEWERCISRLRNP